MTLNYRKLNYLWYVMTKQLMIYAKYTELFVEKFGIFARYGQCKKYQRIDNLLINTKKEKNEKTNLCFIVSVNADKLYDLPRFLQCRTSRS